MNGNKSTQRVITPYSPPIAYTFSPISKGGHTGMITHIETNSPYFVYQCQDGTVGSTLVHELLNSGGSFFSINRTEVVKSVSSGYTLNRFAWLCLQQPHDKPEAIRNIDLYKEFRNVYSPLH